MLVDDIGVAAKDGLAAGGFPVDSARRVLPGFVAKDPARRPETSVPVVGPGRVAVALPATADRLGPRLQFYDVVFGIGHVAPGHPSAIRRYQVTISPMVWPPATRTDSRAAATSSTSNAMWASPSRLAALGRRSSDRG